MSLPPHGSTSAQSTPTQAIPVALEYTPEKPGSGLSAKTALVIVCGAVAVVIIVGIVAFPAFVRSRQEAARARNVSNMRLITAAIMNYAAANNGTYPSTLGDVLIASNLSPDVFVSPGGTDTPAPGSTPQQQAAHLMDGGHLSYIYPGRNSNVPPPIPVLYEASPPIANQGINMAFADGHVELVPHARAQMLIQMAQSGMYIGQWHTLNPTFVDTPLPQPPIVAPTEKPPGMSPK